MSIHSILPNEFAKLQDSKPFLLDVRTSAEFNDMRLAMPVTFMPLEELNVEAFASLHGITKDTPLYFLCASGRRAQMAAEKFAEAEFANLYVLEGGFAGIKQSNLKLIDKKAGRTGFGSFSIERQVRVIAGSFLLVSLLVSLFAGKAFVWAAIAISCGLVFAGLSNWCGLAILLAKAPWNKHTNCANGACPMKKP